MPYANPQDRAANLKAYASTPEGKEARLRANREYRRRNAKKLAAHNAVAKAVLRHGLKAWPACAAPGCEASPTEAHHADYDNQLGVTWLCESCHKEAHRLFKRLVNAT